MNNGISPKAPAKEKIKSDFESLIRGMNWTGMIDCIAYDHLFDGAMPMFNKMYELGKKEATTWHPYPEEKPPKDDWYLITYLDKSGEKWVITEEYDKKKERFFREPFDLSVLAWAYAPEPFEEKENGRAD